MVAASKLHSHRSHLDLETIRETLLYALSDTGRAPGLSGISAAIKRTIEEIDAVQETVPAVPARCFRVVSFIPRASGRAAHAAEPKTEAACSGRPLLPSNELSKQKLRVRTGYGDRAFLQQAITDFVKSRRV